MKKIILMETKRKIALPFQVIGFFTLFLCLGVSFASASSGAASVEYQNGIHYGSVVESQGSQIGIEYRSPSGETHFLCDVETHDCKSLKSGEDFFGSSGSASTFATVSPDGSYGLRAFAVQGGEGIHVYYSLYDISGESPHFIKFLPFSSPALKKVFTGDSEHIVFITPEKKAVRYSLSTGNTTSIDIPGTDLPFWLVSLDGSYMSSYSYSAGAHRIYDLETGDIFDVKSHEPSYLEFGTGGIGAYKDSDGDLDAIYVVDLRSRVSGKLLPQKVSGGGVIKDYIFVGDRLFFMSNVGHPLQYSIYEYDIRSGASKEIAEDVSYGVYMKAVHGKLLYQKLDGKNANIFSYDPQTGKTHEFEPVGASPLSGDISREIVHLKNGRYGVLLSPKQRGANDGDLFIWLHGGPMRQVSLGYHSYLSYGVYDELLNRLANSGVHVLKLDYTGSSGYGEKLLDGLHMQVGKVDVEDVMSAVSEMKDRISGVRNVYLIGNSYGGYLSLKALVDHPKYFEGAIAISPVTDWYGLINQIPSSPFKKLFEGVPDIHNLEAYRSASVYANIPTFSDTKKILLQYGEKDTEVPNWQSTDFIKFAKHFDVNLDTLVFPDEGHIVKKRENLDKLCRKIVKDYDLSGASCHL